jgi:hypothetical protein
MVYGFGAFFNLLPGGDISSLLLIYGFPITVGCWGGRERVCVCACGEGGFRKGRVHVGGLGRKGRVHVGGLCRKGRECVCVCVGGG